MIGDLRSTPAARIALIAVIAAGAFLRFWHLTTGLPYRIGVDEPVIAERAIHILKSGDFNPHFFDYPGLYIYVQMLVGCARFIWGAIDGRWASIEQFQTEHLFAWTRAFNAALGTATIFVVYRAGLRWGRWAAVLAAVLLAVWPNHVRESHFALTDVPLTLLTTMALVSSLRAHETGRLAWFLTAGATVGMAAATKYNGGVALIMPLAAAAGMRPPSMAGRRALAVVGAAAAAFFIGAPYTFLDLPGFLNGFGALAHALGPRTLSSGAPIYLDHLVLAIGWTGVVVAGLGFVWGAMRAVHDRAITQWVILLAFPLVYFDMVATKGLIFGRYLLPVVPFLCVVIAVVIADASAWILQRQLPTAARASAVAAIVIVILFHPARVGIAWPRTYGEPTTQDAAYRLIQAFIPPQSGVAIERSAIKLPESVYHSIDVRSLTDRSREAYVTSGIRYLIASSDAFGPIFQDPQSHPEAYESYQLLLGKDSECLPPVIPTTVVPGPQIRICRLQTP